MDQANALFEIVGAAILWLNVWRLYKDRVVYGVSVFTVLFFTLWGIWSPIYYKALHQPLSMACSVFGFAANFTWVILYTKIKVNERYRKKTNRDSNRQ